jgi:hypothetical protein
MCNGPRDADGTVEYLKKQVGPASVEIRTVEDATRLIGDKGVVGVCYFADSLNDKVLNSGKNGLFSTLQLVQRDRCFVSFSPQF